MRERRNAVERSLALGEPIAPAPPPTDGAPPGWVDLSQPLRASRQRVLDAFERQYLTRLLEECGGNVSEASRRSGLERMSMYRRLRRLGMR